MNSIEVKSGRRKFVCTTKDKIMDNGNCYQLVTKKYQEHYYWLTPQLSKAEFKRLLKLGVLSEPYDIISHGYKVTMYDFKL